MVAVAIALPDMVAAQVMILEIDTERDVTINGIGSNDKSGVTVATGDINNDGPTDMIIGANEAGSGDGGEAYVVFGPVTAEVMDLSAQADLTVNGAAGDISAQGVAAGDLNGDGVDDLIVGAERAAPGGITRAGETYVIFGPQGVGTLNLAADAAITISGINAFDLSGISVGSGDLNGDGTADLIIGAQGADPSGRSDAGTVYVIFGPIPAGLMSLASDADVVFNGISAGDALSSPIGIGDINNDGADDLIIGAVAAAGNAGEYYVIFGPVATGTLEVTIEADVTASGIFAGDSSGYEVNGGDFNNDGVDDLLIGAPLADPDGRNAAGQAYVVLGPLTSGNIALSTDADVIYNGISAVDQLAGVSTGDANNDGAIDLLLGAQTAGGKGQTYVVFGEPPPVGEPVPSVTSWGLVAMTVAAASFLAWRRRLAVGHRGG